MQPQPYSRFVSAAPNFATRFALFIAALASSTFVLTVPGNAADGDSVEPSLLFVFDGSDARLEPVRAKPGVFTLTMPVRKSNHLVTWFTDRPVRDAGHLPLESFVNLWNSAEADSFKNDPPNVAIDAGGKTLVATMTAPKITKSPDGKSNLTTTMTLVSGQSLKQLKNAGGHLAVHSKRATKNSHSRPLEIANVSVFVDVFNTSDNCDGGYDPFEIHRPPPGTCN
jgi:hypothetical protein